jgi:lipopolysaccharide transport system ATP-binding protein
MSQLAVRAVGLGKEYHIGAQQTGYRTLRDQLADGFVAPFRRVRKLLRGQATGASELDETFWALKDLNFEVPEGQVIGIIGKNGAGKSTLLKVLSRITEPTEGYADITGRVGSLLEVGTGFHPELTGRENIYLNGAILGMKRAEIDERFDEIVDFSEIEKFMDTPVKHYSSGMYVRLAFSVAAHLEPEILVVDEVLSVGDAAFQKKCLGKMGRVANSGRTVIFVSHNMGAVTELCERALLLEGGRITLDGKPTEVVSTYLSAGEESTGVWVRPEDEPPAGDLWVRSVGVLTGDGRPTPVVPFNDRFHVEIAYEVERSVRDLVVLLGVKDSLGNLLWASYDTDTTEWAGLARPPGSYVSRCTIPGSILRPGRYHVNVCALVPNVKMLELHEHALAFDVSTVGFRLDSGRPGVLAPMLEWEIIPGATGAVAGAVGTGYETGPLRP